MTKEQVLIKLQAIQLANIDKGTSITSYCNGDVLTFAEYNKNRRESFHFYNIKDEQETDRLHHTKIDNILRWMNEIEQNDATE